MSTTLASAATEPTPPPVCVFAYGSNMLTARLRERVPSAVAIGTGRLLGHTLKWDKQSRRDGSGKCDAERTGKHEDIVWGVIFEIDTADKPKLDRAEGLNGGYVERQVNIVTDRGPVEAVAYIATAKNSSLSPYEWYKAFVIAGAREHGLPQAYIRSLEHEPSVPDPDLARAMTNELLLKAS